MKHFRLLLHPRILLPMLAAIVAVFLAGILVYRLFGQPRTEQTLVLVVADHLPLDSVEVGVWVDAARESGLPLRPVHASRLLRPKPWPTLPIGIILPDELYTRGTRALTERLKQYVRDGGNLMVVYDAATRFRSGDAENRRALLSDLVGIDYALSGELRDAAIQRAPVSGPAAFLETLHLPPGKYMPMTGNASTITTYAYGEIAYPHFTTRGPYDGQVLLESTQGSLIAGLRKQGRGQVLFVNLPLGYLKLRTDGVLLHGFVSWFGRALCGLPSLLAVPDGVGGLVLNWHIDSNASLAPLIALQGESTLLAHGPFSVHFTAGPDTYSIGDGSGLNLESNPMSQRWVRYFQARGDAIGSHGGWIHNVFAKRINDRNGAKFSPWIARNNAVLERITGLPVLEYSAPEGNQPQWVTDWLGAHGVLGYYFTGDTGMSPTRTYRDGRRSDRTTWAFPVSPYGRVASFEDADEASIPQEEISRWLERLVAFSASDRSARLFYFHPPGGLEYLDSLQRLLKAADARRDAFRWYTISGLSSFLNRREKTRWSLDEDGDGWLLRAENPAGLEGQAWIVPALHYRAATRVEGDVSLTRIDAGWLLRAGSGERISVRLEAAKPR